MGKKYSRMFVKLSLPAKHCPEACILIILFSSHNKGMRKESWEPTLQVEKTEHQESFVCEQMTVNGDAGFDLGVETQSLSS